MVRTFLSLMLAMALVALSATGAQALSTRAEIAFTKGIIAFDDGRFDEALQHFQTGLDEAPSDPHLNLYAGLALIAMGRNAEAVAPLRKTLELVPSLAEPGVPERPAAEMDPALKEAHYYLGIALFRTEQFAEALVAFRAAQQHQPDEAVLYYYEGISLQKLGRFAESIEPFDKAAELDPEFQARSRFYKGIALYGIQKTSEARAAFQEALELGPPGELQPTIRRFLAVVDEGVRPPSRFRLTLYMGFDYDDNVIAEPNGFTNKILPDGSQLLTGPVVNRRNADGRAALQGTIEYSHPLTKSIAAGFRYRVYGAIHGNLPHFNVNAHWPAVFAEFDHKLFRLRAEYEYNYTFLGNDASLQMHSFGPSLVVPFGRHVLSRLEFRFRDKLFFENRLRDSDEYLLISDTFIFPKGPTGFLRLGYALSEDSTVGREYDSEANIFSGGFLLPLPWRMSLAGDAFMELRDYDEDFFLLGPRDDNILTVPVRLIKHIDNKWAFILSYTGIKADSNIPDLDYDENIYSGGIQYNY